MQRIVTVAALACSLVCAAAADPHPQSADILAYLERHPIERVAPGVAEGISRRSMDLNAQGMQAYGKKQWAAALDLFRRAILEDDRNSMAYYNAACVMALQFPALQEKDRYAMEMQILRFLVQAVERHWYWALQLQADGDLDAVRAFCYLGPVDGLRLTLSYDYEYGSVYNTLSGDGIVSNSTPREGGLDLGRGWFCVIANHVIEYLPGATSRIGAPPEENVVYMIPVERFWEETYR